LVDQKAPQEVRVWLERLRTMLKPAVRNGSLSPFHAAFEPIACACKLRKQPRIPKNRR
jgi:hypothetical protein